MTFASDSDKTVAGAIASLSYCNPFLPERIGYERDILGDAFVQTDVAWHKRQDMLEDPPNILMITEKAEKVAARCRDSLFEAGCGTAQDMATYEDVVLYLIYYRYEPQFINAIRETLSNPSANIVFTFYDDFVEDLSHFLRVPDYASPSLADPAHLFACFYQVRRAFYAVFDNVIGSSMPTARLRAAIWQSIFTHDMRRYRRSLFGHMRDITTLVTGPSGTGKELVARAIGVSAFIPFNASKRVFAQNFVSLFQPINLSALSPSLIESELFGHAKGAFTGAIKERAGFFETCPEEGTVFLDEMGELDPAIQVKLLRVLQTRTFQRIGEATPRDFKGKIVAATNRDLTALMRERKFREDLYYRLCSDIVTTPALRDQLSNAPEQLHNLLLFLTARIAGLEESEPLTDEVETYINTHLGADYGWPGNVRELEQCVRNILVRKAYCPATQAPGGEAEELLASMRQGELTADDLLRHYCTMVYATTGSYQETARRLRIDRRTAKSRVDPELLRCIKGDHDRHESDT